MDFAGRGHKQKMFSALVCRMRCELRIGALPCMFLLWQKGFTFPKGFTMQPCQPCAGMTPALRRKSVPLPCCHAIGPWNVMEYGHYVLQSPAVECMLQNVSNVTVTEATHQHPAALEHPWQWSKDGLSCANNLGTVAGGALQRRGSLLYQVSSRSWRFESRLFRELSQSL